MSDSTVTLPLWLAVLAGTLAAWVLLARLLLPSVRWFVGRRIDRLIAELNSRLDIRIRPFSLTRRQVLVASLTYDPQVLATVEAQAEEEKVPLDVVLERVARYAREIVPGFNAYVYFRIGQRLARRLARNLYRVRLLGDDGPGLAGIAPDAAVVFVMNHRSNMDYVLMAFLAGERTALSYAAGEWARVWPLRSLVRAMGAYFVRRDSGNPLYRRVLRRYVQQAIAGGVTQAVFLEGGLSRDGALGPAKLGLLGYMLHGFSPRDGRDIVFVPVGINYDRVLEAPALLRKGAGRATRDGTRRALRSGIGFLVRNIFLLPKRERTRFGYACVGFGEAVSLRGYLTERNIVPAALNAEERAALVEALGRDLMTRVGRAVPAPPVALVASLFDDRPDHPLSEAALSESLTALVEVLRAKGARVLLPGDEVASALRAGLRGLTEQGAIRQSAAGHYEGVPGEEALVSYYANSIRQLGEDQNIASRTRSGGV